MVPSTYLKGSLQPSVILAPRHLVSSGFHRNCIHIVHLNALKQNISSTSKGLKSFYKEYEKQIKWHGKMQKIKSIYYSSHLWKPHKQGNQTSEARKGTTPWEEEVQSWRSPKKKFCGTGDNLFLSYNCDYLIELLL